MTARIRERIGLVALIGAAAVSGLRAQNAVLERPDTVDAAAARAGVDRALGFLLDTQRDDGAFGHGVLQNLLDSGFAVETYYDYHLAACALACLALLEADETPDRLAALQKGLRYLCTTRMPRRGSDWDVDQVWAALYGAVATVRAADDSRFAQESELGSMIADRGRAFVALLVRTQSPEGGWAYYDDPPFSRRPTWSTSFCTALVLPALDRALELGWLDDEAVVARARRYVERCALPGDSYEYDLRPIPRITGGENINRIKGSLGRTQVCNWALARVGSERVDGAKIRRGLEAFLKHHRFLDVARMRPRPHEAYYANAGYFYSFGHYYAGLVIGELPPEEREGWHARLRPHVLGTFRADGSVCDYQVNSYMAVASTSFAALALMAGS